jgi:hypothetical protein
VICIVVSLLWGVVATVTAAPDRAVGGLASGASVLVWSDDCENFDSPSLFTTSFNALPDKATGAPPSTVSLLLTSEPLLVSLRRPVTNLVVKASDETGVVMMLVVVHPCGPGRRQTPILFPDLESFL